MKIFQLIIAVPFMLIMCALMVVLSIGALIGFAVLWLIGAKIKVTKGDETLGYIRWFEFIKK